jgi:hypothetical protein
LSLETAAGAAAPGAQARLIHRSSPCYGTFPVSKWRPREAVVETYSVPIPGDLPPGAYALAVTVKDHSGQPLAPSRSDEHHLACFLSNIEIRR